MSQAANKVILGNMPTLPYAMEEAMNRLRINISFLGHNVRKIMVVSTMPDEGKSFVTMQLWHQMAKSETSAILLDADLRKSVTSDKYEIKREDGKKIKGTSHYLAGDYDLEDAILHTEFEGGDILPNVDNVINPSMLLESEKFEQMLDYMGKKYRYVFIDAPPLNMVSDGERIGNLSDGAVLVVRGGVTSKVMVKNSIRQLERAGCPLLGIVLNRVEGAGSGYYSKRYGGRYYYRKKYYGYGGYGVYGKNGDAYYGSTK